MLKLEKLTISGFKSFSDRTEVLFESGVTAVVGPNGCGKSNIGDAINWVLGEQSPKHLRGRAMMDVIFGGSAARKPQGLAEVSIRFSGADGFPFSDNNKVTLTRKLFRSGDSEYRINGAKSRLKDIQEILRQAHIGTKTYSKIEQGRIDQILNSKPKDRRQIIEDAAGIAGYKHKRRLTELKLEGTEANLLRVNDIVIEVERQIRSVKRQAGKARRYKELREELREKDRVRFAMRAISMQERLEAATQVENQARDAEAEAAAGLSQREVGLIDQRQKLNELQQAFRATSERVHELDLEVDRDESQIAALKERIVEMRAVAERASEEVKHLAARAEAERAVLEGHANVAEQGASVVKDLDDRHRAALEVQQESEQQLSAARDGLEELRRQQFAIVQSLTEGRNRLKSLEESLERGAQQRARLEAEQLAAQDDLTRFEETSRALQKEVEATSERVVEFDKRYSESELSLTQSRDQLNQVTESLTVAREQERSAQAKLGTLQDLSTKFAGVSDGVRSLLAEGARGQVRTRGVVADFIEAGAEVERAAEGYLSWLLPTVILESDEDVTRAAAMLRGQGAGRTSILSRTQPAGALAVGSQPDSSGASQIPASLLADSRVRGRLRDQLSLKTSINGALSERIGDALLVDSIETALELHRQVPGVDYLTHDGDVVYASGLIVIGEKGNSDKGLLAHNRQIQETEQEFEAATQRAAALREERERLIEAVQGLEATVRDSRQALEAERARQLELRMQFERSDEDKLKSGRRRDVIVSELEALQAQSEATRATMDAMVLEVSGVEKDESLLVASLSDRGSEVGSIEAQVRNVSQQVTDLRAELAAARQKQESLDGERRRSEESLKELEARIAAETHRGDTARQRSEEAVTQQAETEQKLVTRLEERKGLAEEAGRREREIAELQRGVGEQEDQLRGDRTTLDRLRETTREAELERARLESDRQHMEELCLQEVEMTSEQVREEVGEEVEGVDLEILETDVADIKRKIERLGPVNVTAIEEFAELEERYGFLTSQKQDLEQSIASLRETIRKINKQSRDKFLAAFNEIRASYQSIYKLLFNGGRADIRLEDGEDVDVLECGIEILAQPPGKRLSGVHLLSGGEKALSAIALLFAIFRYQPSPFCMLDEVDAALDEANVGRFSRMLREYCDNTQFILITHNKVSMEQADVIYGVTMEEAGVSRVVSMNMGAA